MRHYCTVFDSKYSFRGLTLWASLANYSTEPFFLWVLALDDETYKAIVRFSSKNLLSILPIHLEEFIDQMRLENCRRDRTYQEWCWTMASQFSEYLMRYHHMEALTYLDADMCFYGNPEVVFTEIGHRSIAVTPHRLIPSKQHLERNGKFNVGWITFKDDVIGHDALYTWAAQCRERCSSVIGCGDQAYLDELPERYGDAVAIIENIGVNAGPWSIGNWKVTKGPLLDGIPLILYHLHEWHENEDGSYFLTGYDLRDEDREFIYKPYVKAYESVKKAFKKFGFHVEQMKEERCHS